jgi:nitrate/TMAO reductase-like tetraheme cytochrome c subunit
MTDHDEAQNEPDRDRHSRRWNPSRRLLVWGAVAFAVLLLAAASLVVTEQSSFCPVCHEMGPYYQAWQAGGHVGKAQCVDCHIDPGVVAHILHKPSELKELWDHFFTDYRFPNYNVDVPNARCVYCHPTVKPKSGSTFSHAAHASRAQCRECHATAGHVVSLDVLQAAGVLKAAATTPPVPAGLTPSAVAGHKKVICQQCHDQANMKCSACHQAPHEPRGECSGCHAPGAKFVWLHGAQGTDCSQCHTPPANHFGANCAACHSPGTPFKDTVFNHPNPVGRHNYRDFPCAKCHPTGYTTSSCTCHGGQAPNGD